MRRTSCGPNLRTARCVPDQPGIIPSPVSGCPILTCASAIRRSAQAASRARPLMCARSTPRSAEPRAGPEHRRPHGHHAPNGGRRPRAKHCSRHRCRRRRRTNAPPHRSVSPPSPRTLDFTTGRDDCIDHFAVKRVQLIRPADRQPGDTFPDIQSNRLAHRPSPIAVERNRAWSISLRPSATRRGVAA